MARTRDALIVICLSAAACAPVSPKGWHPSPTALRSIALPEAPAGGVLMDYLAYDRPNHRVWIPAGNTGRVDVVDTQNDRLASIGGFATSEMERHGQKRLVGPSSATVGDEMVYIGNRADSTVCAVGAVSLKINGCVKIDAVPDGIAYVRASKEVWVTTPGTQSISIVDVRDATALKVTGKIAFAGEPEGFVVDEERSLFFTNLEDKDRTLTIDIKSHQIVADWASGCGEAGPKGLALDRALDFLFVACAASVKVLDAGHGGKALSTLATGDGVDDIAYVEERHELFAAAARAAKLTIAAVDSQGKLTAKRVLSTTAGARNAVATEAGVAYLTDGAGGQILVVPALQ
jgi:DNA-binding beta-propeller fold protein YncE